MIVTHVAVTPLAGSPGRISSALCRAGVDSRHIILHPHAYGKRTFPVDMLWNEEARTRLLQSDIVHFHHYFDLTRNPFAFDFTRLKGRIVRQFHSAPDHAAQATGESPRAIINSQIPQLVIAQYHARYYTQARVVPNLTPYTAPQPSVSYAKPAVIFTPSGTTPAHASRWETKGYDRVLRVLDSLPQAKVSIVTNTPFEECHRLRRLHNIAIDDVVTGSFHLTSLDSLALGLATISYLDQPTQSLFQHLTGAPDLPIVSVPLPSLRSCLQTLILDPSLLAEQGEYSAWWMHNYYSESILIKHYLDAYASLGSTWEPARPRSNPSAAIMADVVNRTLIRKPSFFRQAANLAQRALSQCRRLVRRR